MCGIALTVNYTSDCATKIAIHQFRRGPNANGEITHKNVTIAHNLLSIIGYQEQPVESERYIMTYNGEIYNFKEWYPTETSDTIALLKSFDEVGIEETLSRANGMYSIGLYDKIFKKVHLIVDRFAQKNLYYFHDGDKFASASAPGALLQFKDKWEIDKDALQSYWLLGSTMGSDSIWKGIKKVCASEWLTLDLESNEVSIKRYWEPTYREDAIDRIEELVIDAIDKVKIADVPIHIFLSGGIDSTLVASRFENGNAIHLNSPEKQWAKYVAERFNINLKTVDPQEINVEEALMDYSFQSGEPSMSALIPYVTAKESSKFGKVAIIANGADELFNGYNRTHDLISNEQIRHTYRDIALPKHEPTWPFHVQFNGKGHGKMWELNGFVQFDLNKTLDFASMCHSLEVRSPFLDHRLVEHALSIQESVHREKGNKTILKNMLRKMGFNEQFLGRPKEGFSLHYKPSGMDALIKFSVGWCLKEGYLALPSTFDKLSPRDQKYLEMSCLGFYYFCQTWKHKIA